MLTRYQVLKILMEYTSDEYIISNIGIPSKELYDVKDRKENFYMLGSMGLASSIGLGVALGKAHKNDKKTIIIDGDGSVLMNMGSLSTIGYTKPKNMLLIIIDNCAYGSTGNQSTQCISTDLEMVAKGCKIDAETLVKEKEIRKTLSALMNEKETKVLVIKTRPHNEKVKNIELDPVIIKERFMESICSK
ncbi:sulfopyruvate decarboxylase subunit beta [Methanococcus voltae]|uniref:sulfopyruvate decarboxylase n=1 Tax=Methanococcus voltae (strain ATCC BAA-1334 / A3) TaxID=456320 RepID=D7DUW8_METV3|nr:sulfopyruvate decarboxylase subunit beta [Methanococcus voltae]MCS3900732.1 sulfopyruvate decarboxylase subunit beta [Methanococcus voltae]